MHGFDPVCNRYKALQKRLNNIDQCVDIDEYNRFIDIYQYHCYLCGEVFTARNPPTFDRINNEHGHSLSSCKIACASCKTIRKPNYNHITCLRIPLAKYCKEYHLSTTVSTRNEYQFWLYAIIVELSFVLQRVNIADETCVNCDKYYFETKKLINYDTPHVITNSLNPSSFLSLLHSIQSVYLSYHVNARLID